MTHGPMASAISLDGDSAPTERPSADAAAVCSASVPSNAPRPATFRPAMRWSTRPNTTGNTASTGISTSSFEKKYGPGPYPPAPLRVSRATVARSRGNPLSDRHTASIEVLMHACINTAARRRTESAPLPKSLLHAPNAAASPALAAKRTALTHASRRVWRHARPTSSAVCFAAPSRTPPRVSGFRARFLFPRVDDDVEAETRTGATGEFARPDTAPLSFDASQASTSAWTRRASAASSSGAPSASTATRSMRNSAGLWWVGHAWPIRSKYVKTCATGPQYATFPPLVNSVRSSSRSKLRERGWCSTATTAARVSAAVSFNFATILSA